MIRKLISLFAACVMLCSIFTGCAKNSTNEEIFTAWVDDSTPIAALKEYVEDVTNEKSTNFIPPEDRIAVFDLDGTLYCETFPIYGEWLLFADYVLHTPDYKAPKEILAVAQELSEIKKANADGFNGMTRGEAFYRPMLEVVDYLLENEFIVYICSGTNRFTVRALIDGVIDIPARQVIGTDFTIVASGQGEEMDMHYNYVEEDELLMGDTVITKNVKMSKVAQLEQELGQRPVLVFGNSTGDVPMAVYAEEENEYLTEVFFLLCDDVEREHGNESKAQKIADICAEKDWVTISMANDWTTIYGENVTINPQ